MKRALPYVLCLLSIPFIAAAAGAEPGTITMQARRSVTAPWESFPATTLDQLTAFQPGAAVPLDQYGGRTDKKAAATGFFYAKNENGRWWLIDPLGGYFINTGVVSITRGSSKTLKENFAARFGDTEHWRKETVSLLRENGFNGAGAWSDVDVLRTGPEKLVYTVMSDFLSSFAKSRNLTRPGVGHSGYVKDSLPVFHPDFEAFCQAYAREKLATYKDDPWMLGVFSDNELLTPDLKKFLTLDPADPDQRPNYEAARQWLVQRLGKQDVSALDVTQAIEFEFAGYVFDRYYAIVSTAVKAVLPHHIYLGSRLNTEKDKVNPHTWKAAGKYVDVIALNLYRTWTPNLAQVRDWNAWSGKPVLITEWYVKGDDAGFTNKTGAGWIVPTQQDRGKFYQQFTINLLASKGIVGWHWFKYMDNDPNDLAAEPSNRDSNKGVVRLDYRPYSEMMVKMKALNREVYPLVDYLDRQ